MIYDYIHILLYVYSCFGDDLHNKINGFIHRKNSVAGHKHKGLVNEWVVVVGADPTCEVTDGIVLIFFILIWEYQWRIWICYRLHLFWITHPGLYWQLQQFSSSENTKTGNSAPALTEAEELYKFLKDCIIFSKTNYQKHWKRRINLLLAFFVFT